MTILERLKELQAKATPGEWKIHKEDVGDEDFIYIPTGIIGGNGKVVVGSVGGLCSEDCNLGEGELEANAELITFLRNNLPALLEVVEVLEELTEVAALRGDDSLPQPCDDPKLWTARMQSAWDSVNAALAKAKEATP